jgi:hypothetical protein
MQTIPSEGSNIILRFSSLFSKKVFEHVKVLLLGALLCIGNHTVCAALRFMGLKDEPRFHKYHRVLSRVKWSAPRASRILLQLLLKYFGRHEGPLVFGIDETIERRRGVKIKAKGIYHDAVRSSHSHFVKCSGLRWMSMMLLCKIKWTDRIWALPFLTALAPSERYCKQHAKHHKTITEWARQMILLLHRWLPGKALVVVADSSYAALELLAAVSSHVSFITRLRLDAALFEVAPARKPGQMGRSQVKGARQPSLAQRLESRHMRWKTIQIDRWYNEVDKKVQICSGVSIWYRAGKAALPIKWVLIKDEQRDKKPVALLSTDVNLQAEEIIGHFIKRWSMEVTFREVREHLGVESQRQWSDQAIACTTPSLMGLFSIVTLWANDLFKSRLVKIQPTAWYKKKHRTFSDALAAVRRQIWQQREFCLSDKQGEIIKIPKALFNELTELLTRAA